MGLADKLKDAVSGSGAQGGSTTGDRKAAGGAGAAGAGAAGAASGGTGGVGGTSGQEDYGDKGNVLFPCCLLSIDERDGGVNTLFLQHLISQSRRLGTRWIETRTRKSLMA
jgi:hypothetical protein